MKVLCVVLACLWLSGCDTLRNTVQIRVPVPVACQEPEPERPVMPTEALRPGVDEFTFTISAQAEIEVREGFEGRLLTALRACRTPIAKRAP
jgi:hypothetical protein